MAVPTYISVGALAHALNPGPATMVPGMPAGIQVGDTLVCVALMWNTGTLSMNASEWQGTSQGVMGANYGTIAVFVRVHDGTTPDTTVTGAVDRGKCCAIFAFRGAWKLSGNTGPTDHILPQGGSSFLSTTISTAEVYTTTDNQLCIMMVGLAGSGGAVSFQTGLTEIFDTQWGSSVSLTMALGIKTVNSGGSGVLTANYTGAYDGAATALTISLVPEGEKVIKNLVAYGWPAATSGTSLTVPIPPRLQNGDLLVCIVNNSVASISMEGTQWSYFLQAARLSMFYHWYAGVDPDRDITRSVGGTNCTAMMIALRNIGQASGDPIHAQTGKECGAANTWTIDSLTTTKKTYNLGLSIRDTGAGMTMADPGTPPYYKRMDYHPSGGDPIAFWDASQSSPGITGDRTVTANTNLTWSGHVAFLVSTRKNPIPTPTPTPGGGGGGSSGGGSGGGSGGTGDGNVSVVAGPIPSDETYGSILDGILRILNDEVTTESQQLTEAQPFQLTGVKWLIHFLFVTSGLIASAWLLVVLLMALFKRQEDEENGSS